MILLMWVLVGVGAGVLVHLLYRALGEQGYDIVGEALLGLLGSVLIGFLAGVIFGWRHVDVTSVLVSLIGAFGVLGVSVYFTLQASPNRYATMERKSRQLG